MRKTKNRELRDCRSRTKEQKKVQDLMWDRKIFIGSRECRVRDLISDPLEPEKCPELELKMAQDEYVRMFVQKGMEDWILNEEVFSDFCLPRQFKGATRKDQFLVKEVVGRACKTSSTEEHLTALDREIELVERQKQPRSQKARVCPSTAAKRGKCCCKLRASLDVFKKRQQ